MVLRSCRLSIATAEAASKKEQAEQCPADAHREHLGIDGKPIDIEVADQTHGDGCRQQRRSEQVRPDQGEIEEAPVEQFALVGHVELAALGEKKQGDQGRLEDMEGQHRLVQLAPEGMAVPALDPGVGHDRVGHVREHVGEDQGGGGAAMMFCPSSR
ncbi:hypothetical protein ACFS3C_02095 [Azotobacter vinelandii]